jgi:hypothetical protein
VEMAQEISHITSKATGRLRRRFFWRYVESSILMKRYNSRIFLIGLLLNPSYAFAAGVDAILAIPVALLIALALTIASIVKSTNKTIPVTLHTLSIIFYLTVAFLQTGHSWTFYFLLLYPILSSFAIFIIALSVQLFAREK